MRLPGNILACSLALAILTARAEDNADWMAAVPGNLSLQALSIPGTHDSGALFEPFPGTAKCQTLTIAGQLNAGVRFLDIRCRHLHDAFAIYHGVVSQNQTFDDVLRAVYDFLNAHPAETVILSVKEESTASGNTRPFERTFDAYVAKNPGKWFLATSIPTLGQARGKIVLFRRFRASTLPKGIDASSWPDNATFNSGNLRVQDEYNVSSNDAKWTAVQKMFAESSRGPTGVLHVNLTSGYQTNLGIPSITSVSDDINDRLAANLSFQPSRKYGIVVMDFADAAMCSRVLAVNPTR